jgi:hypothetical protein
LVWLGLVWLTTRLERAVAGGFTQFSNGFLLFSEQFADGGQYEGSWQKGRYSGFGTCTWEGMLFCVCVCVVPCGSFFVFVLK